MADLSRSGVFKMRRRPLRRGRPHLVEDTGFGLLCRKSLAAVVPVLIDGAFECWPKNKKIFALGSKIVVSYGNCIPADDVAKMSDEQLADNLTQILRSMQKNCRLEHKKQPYKYNQ